MSANDEPLVSKEPLYHILENIEQGGLVTYEERKRRIMKFKPRPSDIFVAGPPKSGTTWVQQIVHQLRSAGDMAFREITYVVPCIDVAHYLETDFDGEQAYHPRCFKSHKTYDASPKGVKYIVIFREPCAVAFSFYNYYKKFRFDPEEVSLHQFVMDFFLKPKLQSESTDYFENLASWWKQRHDPRIMFLFYEEMKMDHENGVRAIASFMGINDEEKIKIAIQHSTFEFMKANAHKFNTNYAFRTEDKQVFPQKVATGSVDRALRVLHPDDKAAIQERWNKILTKETGCETYEEFKIALRKDKPLVF